MPVVAESYRPPWVGKQAEWLASLTPAIAVDTGGDVEVGRTFTYEGMNPQSAADMVDRIFRRRELAASATELRSVVDSFATGDGLPAVAPGNSLPLAKEITDPQAYTPMDNNGNRLPDLPTVPNPNNNSAHHRNPQPSPVTPPSTAVTDSPGTLWPGQSVPAGAPGTPEYTPGKQQPQPSSAGTRADSSTPMQQTLDELPHIMAGGQSTNPAVTDGRGTLWPGQSVPAGAPATVEYAPGQPQSWSVEVYGTAKVGNGAAANPAPPLPDLIAHPRVVFVPRSDYSQPQLDADLARISAGPIPWVGDDDPYLAATARLEQARYTPAQLQDDLQWMTRTARNSDELLLRQMAFDRLAAVGIYGGDPAVVEYARKHQNDLVLTSPSDPPRYPAPPPIDRGRPPRAGKPFSLNQFQADINNAVTDTFTEEFIDPGVLLWEYTHGKGNHSGSEAAWAAAKLGFNIATTVPGPDVLIIRGIGEGVTAATKLDPELYALGQEVRALFKGAAGADEASRIGNEIRRRQLRDEVEQFQLGRNRANPPRTGTPLPVERDTDVLVPTSERQNPYTTTSPKSPEFTPPTYPSAPSTAFPAWTQRADNGFRGLGTPPDPLSTVPGFARNGISVPSTPPTVLANGFDRIRTLPERFTSWTSTAFQGVIESVATVEQRLAGYGLAPAGAPAGFAAAGTPISEWLTTKFNSSSYVSARGIPALSEASKPSRGSLGWPSVFGSISRWPWSRAKTARETTAHAVRPLWEERISFYHGTTRAAAADLRENGIDIARGQAEADFGRGFYTTRVLSEASDWAHVASNKFGGEPWIVEFRVPVRDFALLSRQVFDDVDPGWIEFVTRNRSGDATMHPYDIVEGPYLDVIAFRRSGQPTGRGQQTSWHTAEAVYILRKALIDDPYL
ncbi:DUF3990 domain-containing protein [Nocardia arthritidis]|uniref:DUF3990 domain-containing protein n=1 Tax=Nocardia arthritidis TaxID=228602 RepID=A0A6G9YTN4_9NOCA|nr:DUF3990 domain-containing protein [Nocardia arthritidis]QIS16564.1 DUF3990 domain-containing protein [Nocardia arthritidis]